ncbi:MULTISPECIES: hypothetical protein [Microbacterium]|uniref:hypothetical protein n=1 Tax=Microbacterium TaxID=33882 RepID=UPI0027877BA1|nr:MULTISPECIES: hypothetical protein [Microbacterium]MDQ1082242.1 hypothetical protein [Microbacterium sp. SORGH_AS_0344]MDQ1168987.1 hypothetical protein [Microbacterium proteolyticum]
MARRTILLSVDGTLLVEIDSPIRAYAAMREGREEAPLPVPDDADVTADGRFFFRPDVHRALREFVADGVDVVWNTGRLIDPRALQALAAEIGLEDAVRFPDAAELPAPPTDDRVDTGPNVMWEHWKVRALVERARTLPEGDEVVVVDPILDLEGSRLPDGLARRTKRPDAAGIGGIHVPDTWGLDLWGVEILREWVAGGAVPRVWQYALR